MDWENYMSDEEFSEHDFDEFKSLASSIEPNDRVRHQPPADLWSRISNEVSGLDAEIDLTDGPDTVEPTAERDLPPAQELPGGDPRFSPRFVVAAAAALIVILIGASLAIVGTGGNSFVTYAAEITNTDLPESFDGSATVTLEVDEDPMLVVDFDRELPSGETLGIWILSADGTEIIPVGMVEPGDTAWAWPEGFNPAEYPLVDVSIEPDDGDPSHSGRSILRGELTTS